MLTRPYNITIIFKKSIFILGGNLCGVFSCFFFHFFHFFFFYLPLTLEPTFEKVFGVRLQAAQCMTLLTSIFLFVSSNASIWPPLWISTFTIIGCFCCIWSVCAKTWRARTSRRWRNCCLRTLKGHPTLNSINHFSSVKVHFEIWNCSKIFNFNDTDTETDSMTEESIT